MGNNGQVKKDKVQVDFRPMESGELQLRKVFEETATHNIKLCVDHANQTRVLVRSLEEQIKNLQKTVIGKDAQLQQMQKQIATLLQDKFKNGS